MKKLLITLLMLLTLGAAARAGEQNPQLRSLVSSYKGTEGFDIVDIGGISLGLLKAAAKSAAETPEDREALKLFNGLKRLTIVDFSDAAPETREKFLRKANRILNGGEMLMEAKDGDETVRIFGTSSEDGSLLEDIALLAGDALIFVRGSIRADQIGALMKQADK
ncbi:MAG: DUF4252 domain-containing protein [Bacteroidales bacterium]|nr:DUF4252 domain-containing protein [Bacteroidales bacterium]